MKAQRLVFLDIDGVLNVDTKWYRQDDYPIEFTLAQRVGQLVTALDAQVVVSSDWRHFYGLPELRTILNQFGGILPKRVLGTTPVPHEQGDGVRGQEIRQWLRNYGHPVRLAILDDNHIGRFNMDVVRPWFVLTDPKVGVSEANITQARNLLDTGPIWAPARQTSAA